MKRTLTVLALCVLAFPALAGIPAKSELGVSGNYVKPNGAGSIYSFDGQLAVPITKSGSVLLGPRLHYSSDRDTNAAGAVLEVNFLGSNKSGPYVGVTGLYNLRDVAGAERYTLDGNAGLKIAIGKGGSGFKVFAAKTVSGRGKDESNYTGNVGLLVRF